MRGGMRGGKLRIVGHPPPKDKRIRNSGRLMYEALHFLESSGKIDAVGSESWEWLIPLLEFLEAEFTARGPSVRDQAGVMVAINSLVSGRGEEDLPSDIVGAARYLLEPMGLSLDADPGLRWFPESPDTGDPLCICSYCEEVIEARATPLRFFLNERETRLHQECFETCQRYGLLPDGTEGRH